jgi:hypothetical protein
MCSESFAKVMQAAMSFNPDTVPPELLRQIRSGVMEALTQSWGEYLRSPQFLEGMKQLMEQAVAFRQFSADLLTKARQETQGVASQDIEGVRAAIGQAESRLAGQITALSAQVNQLIQRLDRLGKDETGPVPAPAPAAGNKRRRSPKRPAGRSGSLPGK